MHRRSQIFRGSGHAFGILGLVLFHKAKSVWLGTESLGTFKQLSGRSQALLREHAVVSEG